MSVITITKDNFENEVINSNKPELLEFWAGWCGPFRLVSPVVDETAKESIENVIGKINVDEQPELAKNSEL